MGPAHPPTGTSSRPDDSLLLFFAPSGYLSGPVSGEKLPSYAIVDTTRTRILYVANEIPHKIYIISAYPV